MQRIRRVNMLLTGLGLVVFWAVLAYVQLAPKDFDQRTRDFAIAKVKDEVGEQVVGVAQSETADKASALLGKFSSDLQDKVDTYRAGLDADIDVMIADVLAAACRLDCERREQARQAIEASMKATIARYSKAIDRVEELVVGKYDAVMDELRGDLSIFAVSTALAFTVAFGLAVFRGRAAKHLLPISLALTGATILMVIWYALGQDWVMTIIFSDYWGWAYAVVLTILSAFMVDIAANKARVTTLVFNAIGSISPGGFVVVPC